MASERMVMVPESVLAEAAELLEIAESPSRESYAASELRAALESAPPGDGLHFSTTEDLASAIRQVSAYEDLGPELIAESIFKNAGASDAAYGDKAVRKDAERYRWLRDYHIGDDPESINLDRAKSKGLNAAIDAAMRAQAGKDSSHA